MSGSRLITAHRGFQQPNRRELTAALGLSALGLGGLALSPALPGAALAQTPDRIVVAGKTFRYTAEGPEGLAGGRRVIVALARGGFYSDDARVALEHLESYLRSVFAFIGIEAEFVMADGVSIGPEQRQAAIDQALGQTRQLAA